MENEELETVIVARGRTVLSPHPSKTRIVREGEDGKPVRAPTCIEHVEGDELSFAPIEAARLIALGIVHRPGEPQVVPAAFAERASVVELAR